MTCYDPNKTYEWLMDGADGKVCDAFDAHVLACVTALAVSEARTSGRPLTDTIGLDAAELFDTVVAPFPQARVLIDQLGAEVSVQRSDDEICLGQLLVRYASAVTSLQKRLSTIIARRALRPNHLWQDLGLRDRKDLSLLMLRHFRPLAERNAGDMKWKKFLYRMICRDGGFHLCTAPCCAECDDFSVCFGDESGESLLADVRRKGGQSRTIPLALAERT